MDWIDGVVSGPMGLLIGAVLGLVLTVVLEDGLKASLQRLGRRLRGRRMVSTISQQGFRLGPIATDCVIVEGDGENVIREESIYIAINTAPLEIPTEVLQWRSEIAAAEEKKRQSGSPAAWNGPNYAIERFTVSRSTISEEPEIHLRLQYCDYFTFMAAQQLDRPLTDGSTLRQKYIVGRPIQEVPAFVSCTLGINVVLITADNQVLFSKRSNQVTSFPGLWSVSANEAVSRSIDSSGRGAPSLYAVARRGVREELGIDDDEYSLDMLGVHLATQKNLWGCDFIARLRSTTADELRERWTRGRADPWEHDEHAFVDFRPRDVLTFIFRVALDGQMTSMGPAIFYLALVNEFGRERVERDIRKISKRTLPHMSSGRLAQNR